jgi:predicted flap endonuclease-1-like 5' DNA nuclease
MFQRWGFLMGEIWLLLLVAALLGLFAGWLIWGRRATNDKATDETASLRSALDSCTAKGRDQTARIATLERDLAAAKAKAADGAAQASATAASLALKAAPAPNAEAAGGVTTMSQTGAAKADAEKPAMAKPTTNSEAAKSDSGETTAPKLADKPQGLTNARNGKPDDLKLIKGVGPKLEALCNKLGFYHFDQIANWTAKEVAWVDDNLEGFKGRVTREDWVQQARDLMNGLPPRPGGQT